MDAIQQMNDANKEFSDWCQTLPIPLILAGCEIHAKVQAAMFRLAEERNEALEELAASSAALDRLNKASETLIAEVKRNTDSGIPVYKTGKGETEVFASTPPPASHKSDTAGG